MHRTPGRGPETSASTRGALESLLGPDAIRHPHASFSIEDDPPEIGFDQGWHRDSYWGVQRVHHHRPRWLLCMYYPGSINVDMGPTAIAPGSQYYALPEDGDGRARPALRNANLRRAVADACARSVQDPDILLGHYCRDTLRALGLEVTPGASDPPA